MSSAPVALALITVLGVALRLVNLDGRTTEYDEIVSIWFAQADPAAMVRGTAADTMPPLYYFLLHLWQGLVPAPDLLAARIPSVLLGTATIPLAYALGAALLDRRSALLGTLVLAVSPFHVFYAQFARMYSLLCLLTLAGALLLVRAAQGGRTRDWVGFVLAETGAFYTHNLAAVNLVGLDLAALSLLPVIKERWRFVLRLGAAHLAIGLLYLPWLAYLPGQLEKVQRAFWIPRPGLTEVVRTPIFWLFNLPAPDGLLPVLLFWSLLLLALGGLRIVRGWRAGEKTTLGVRFLVALALAPVAVMFLISQVRPIYVERGVMMASVAFYLVLAWGLSRMPSRVVRAGLVAGSAALLALSLGSYYRYAEFPRSPYREAAAVLARDLAPGEVVLHDTKLSFFPMSFFRPDLPQGFLADPPGSPNDTLAPETMRTFGLSPTDPDRAAQEHARLWFVVHQRALDEAQDAGVPHANLARLSAGRTAVRTERVGDLLLILLRAEP
ncbi:MAG: glycosyltransferase family 39 protein [Chloroflexi bacterium]|nr:glycosyltransferase family 39 protein [Chloroflexota bacterium]